LDGKISLISAMSLTFSTKARNLLQIKDLLQQANILPIVYFTVEQWHKDSSKYLEKAFAISEEKWIVRSSCLAEDSTKTSNAGAFLSVLHVTKEELKHSVEKVIASYKQHNGADEVLIQPMLPGVIQSGVAFSHDPNTCAPYRVINWTEGSNTTAVTSGENAQSWQQAALSPLDAPEHLAPVIVLLEELGSLYGGIPLDCEFAITGEAGDQKLWLLQVRPLILRDKVESKEEQAERLQVIVDKVQCGMRPHPFLMGRRTVYGVMPDWNPAEIIGVRPRPLALSLYRELVTDSIWAYQRHNYGYRNLRSFPLMPHFFGLPYIDVRLSFNSFIPADLEDGLAGRLVDHYIDSLLAEPTLHDKVEFEIVYSCYTLDLPKRLERLSEAGFSKHDRETLMLSLRDLTNKIVHPKDGLWRSDADRIKTLNSRREVLQNSSSTPIERIYWLLEDAKRYGTLPFAGLARAGFVAIQMLKSLVEVGVLTLEDYDAFMGSVSTVSGQLARDLAILDKSNFLSRYGHLRPGTYDILSLRYDERPELYFDWEKKHQTVNYPKPFSLTLPQMRDIVGLLKDHGLHPDPVGLFDFLQAGIELREMAKFHFTRNLSDAMALMIDMGSQYNISREDLSYCDISAFKELYVGAIKPKDALLNSIEQGKKLYANSLRVSLPPLISNSDQIWAFETPATTPNFITQKQVSGAVVGLKNLDNLKGAIVCIPNADPGFDWLFSHGIAGMITTWGGVNSHMAIRAGELGLPAVIGAGEKNFRLWSGANQLHMDCATRRIEVLS
jgi:glutamine kinase